MQRRGSFYFNLIPWPASLSCSLAFLATPISRSRLVSWLLTRVYIPFNTRFRFPVRDRPYPRNPLLFRGESISTPETQVLYLAPTRIRVIAICQREERIRYSTNKPRHYSTFCSHLDRSYIRSSREIAFEINLFPVESKRTTVKNPPLSRNRSDRIEKVSDARSSCTLEKGQTDFDSVEWKRERETSEQRSWLESPAAGCFGVGRRKEESGIVLKQG